MRILDRDDSPDDTNDRKDSLAVPSSSSNGDGDSEIVEVAPTEDSTASSCSNSHKITRRRESPPWTLHEEVEESLVVDNSGVKRSTRKGRPEPGSLKE